MAKLPEIQPAYITYHHPDGTEEQFKVTGTSWSGIDGVSMSLQARLTPLSRTHTVDYNNFTIPFTKEATVANKYDVDLQKNTAIDTLVMGVQQLEQALFQEKQQIDRVRREQAAKVENASAALNHQIAESIHAGVTLEDLRKHFPNTFVVLQSRMSELQTTMSVDNAPALV